VTRVLFWNLQKFGINKIDNPDMGITPGHGGNSNRQASHQRRTVIERVITAASPDIIVVVEVSSGQPFMTPLASASGGMFGLFHLLERLRLLFPLEEWRLVPPLRVGQHPRSEAVGILYRGNIFRQNMADGQLYFTGPNGWVGNWLGSSTAPGAGVVFNPYPGQGLFLPDLSTLLTPPNTPARQVPAAALHNGGAQEDTLAARVEFRPSALYNRPTTQGGFVDYGPYRQPYMATFTRVDAQGNVSRNFTIFAVHPSPANGIPQNFLTSLTYLADVVAPLGANETRVIGGDFNLELLNPVTGGNSGVYAALNTANYTYVPLLQSPGPPPANDLNAFKGYFATHIRDGGDTTVDSLFLWSSSTANSPYPGYGYTGANLHVNFKSIDSILVWPHVVGAAYNTTILNTITGAPYAAGQPPGGAPQGGPLPGNPLPSLMSNPPGWARAHVAAAPTPPSPNAPNTYTLGQRRSLVGWTNYGHLKNTSDHFAIVADIPDN